MLPVSLAAAAGSSSLPSLGPISATCPCHGWRFRSDRSGRECTDPGWPHSERDPVCLHRWSCRTAGRGTGFRAGDQPIPVAGAAVSFVRLAVRTSSRAQPSMGTPPGLHGCQSGGPGPARTGGPRNQQRGHTLANFAIVGLVPVIRTDAAMHGEQGDLMRYDWGCCGTCGPA